MNTPIEIETVTKNASLPSAYENQLREKDAIIDNIKLQYDNLMDIANKYRDEAHKWYKKYIERTKFPMQGSLNLTWYALSFYSRTSCCQLL